MLDYSKDPLSLLNDHTTYISYKKKDLTPSVEIHRNNVLTKAEKGGKLSANVV